MTEDSMKVNRSVGGSRDLPRHQEGDVVTSTDQEKSGETAHTPETAFTAASDPVAAPQATDTTPEADEAVLGDALAAETDQDDPTPKVGWTLETEDMAESQQDPLLDCLVFMTRHFERSLSRDALVSGLPLDDGTLTPGLFPRAAQRAGLSARLIKRPLHKISSIVLPAVLLLDNKQACVLLRWASRDEVVVMQPEAGSATVRVTADSLKSSYTGYALFLRPEHRFDNRTDTSFRPDGKHWFWGTVGRLWPAYLEVIVAAALINVLALASPLFIMNVYDRVLPNEAFSTLWVLAAGIGIAFLFDFLLKTLRGVLIDSAGRRADVIMASTIFEQVLNMKLEARPGSTGAFANHLREFESVRDFFTSATLVSLLDLLFVGLFVFVIWMVAGPLAYIPLIAMVIAIICALVIQIPLARTVRRTQMEAAQKHGILVETVSSLDTIKSLGAEGRMQRSWERFVGATSRTSQRSRMYSNLGINLTGFVQQASSVCTVVGGVYLVSEGEITMGAIIAAVILGGRAVGPLSGIAGTLSRMNQSLSALSTLNELMRMPVERPRDRNFISRPITQGAIEFRDVTFAYPESKQPALRDMSFSLQPGERVGVIGRIGSGKTTLSRLLVGFYEPAQGSVMLDGTDLRQFHPADVRRGIGMVMQDVTLFAGTVRDNIAIGAPQAEDAMILRAAQLAGVDSFHRQPSHGL